MKPIESMTDRELDAAVAEKVMGHTIRWTNHEVPMPFLGPWRTTHMPGECPRWVADMCPFYSTDIAAAWEVVEKMREREPLVRTDGNEWACVMHASDDPNDQSLSELTRSCERNRLMTRAPTATRAICLAALRAKGCK